MNIRNLLNIRYKIKRRVVLYKQRTAQKAKLNALRNMSTEQKKVYHMVTELAIKNTSSIKFDPYTLEILIVLPKMLITLKHDNIHIHNTTGFLSIPFRPDAYEIIVNIIKVEANRERRRLKYEVKERINDYLTKLSENTLNKTKK